MRACAAGANKYKRERRPLFSLVRCLAAYLGNPFSSAEFKYLPKVETKRLKFGASHDHPWDHFRGRPVPVEVWRKGR